jgi:hypothetical protein
VDRPAIRNAAMRLGCGLRLWIGAAPESGLEPEMRQAQTQQRARKSSSSGRHLAHRGQCHHRARTQDPGEAARRWAKRQGYLLRRVRFIDESNSLYVLVQDCRGDRFPGAHIATMTTTPSARRGAQQAGRERPDRARRRRPRPGALSAHSITGTGECDNEAVALALLDGPHATTGRDGLGHCSIEACNRGRHLVWLGLRRWSSGAETR